MSEKEIDPFADAESDAEQEAAAEALAADPGLEAKDDGADPVFDTQSAPVEVEVSEGNPDGVSVDPAAVDEVAVVGAKQYRVTAQPSGKAVMVHANDVAGAENEADAYFASETIEYDSLQVTNADGSAVDSSDFAA